jgi:hypothetical protein
VAAGQGDAERAGILWGAVEREESRGPCGQWEAERDAYWSRIEQPDWEQFDLGRARGLQLSPDETMRDALSVD